MITVSLAAKRVDTRSLGFICVCIQVYICVYAFVCVHVCVCSCIMSVFNPSRGDGLINNLINIHQVVWFLSQLALMVVPRTLGVAGLS